MNSQQTWPFLIYFRLNLIQTPGASVTAGSFKLWLFTFLNTHVFSSVVAVPGSGAVRSDAPKSLLTWLTALVWPEDSAPSEPEASPPAAVWSSSSQTLVGGANGRGSAAGGGCDSADELVDTEDCVAAALSTQSSSNTASQNAPSAGGDAAPQTLSVPPQQSSSLSPSSSSSSTAAEKDAPIPASSASASNLPDFLLDFNLFFFGFNYGVVLLPPSPSFAYADSAFAPLLRSPASLQHPEAPMSTAATRGSTSASRSSGVGAGAGLAASAASAPHDSSSSSSSSSAPPQQQQQSPPSPSSTVSASTDGQASKPYAPVLSSVRTPMRRLGNIVWYAEVGVPLPISWLILQVRCACVCGTF